MPLSQLTFCYTHIPDTVMLALFTSLLSLFLEFTFREDNIFEGWLRYWGYGWLKKNNPAILLNTETKTDDEIKVETKYDTVREYRLSHVKWFLYKPLGGCVVCMNVWLCIPFIHVNLIHSLMMILVSNFIVRYFKNKII